MHNFRTYFFLSIILFQALQITAQEKEYFTSPVDIPIFLSGTFGELRSNHFHSGIDIKTQGVEGKNILAVADGYISRIKISTGGYGKALYITHNNGYVSVYGHLQRYNDSIQKYVIDKQYEKESFTINIFPDKGELQVKQGEIIAFSGNTGGSMGPHLHFEIRETKTQHPVNPMQFSAIKVKDYYRPRITTMAVYPANHNSYINDKNDTAYYNVQGWGIKHRINDTISAYGDISFGVSTYDLMNEIHNKNGVYSIEAYFDSTLFCAIKMDEISFSTTRYINSMIDYSYAMDTKTRIVRTQRDTNNILKNYHTILNNGIISVNDTLYHQLTYIVKDIYNNISKIDCVIKGKKPDDTIKEIPSATTPYYIEHSKTMYISDSIIDISFPANCFYRSFAFEYNTITQRDSLSNIYQLHNRFTPVHKPYTISVNLPHTDTSTTKHIYLAYSSDNKDYSFSGNTIKNGVLKAKSRNLGYYKLTTDSISPIIIFKNFSDSTKITNLKKLEITIKDKETGILNYTPTLNGKWILMEYDAKKNRLTYNLDKHLKKGRNEFQIKVEDLCGNILVRNAVVYY